MCGSLGVRRNILLIKLACIHCGGGGVNHVVFRHVSAFNHHGVVSAVRLCLTILQTRPLHVVDGQINSGIAGADYFEGSGNKRGSAAFLRIQVISAEVGAVTLNAVGNRGGLRVKHLIICYTHNVQLRISAAACLVSRFVKLKDSAVIGQQEVQVEKSLFGFDEVRNGHITLVVVKLSLCKGLRRRREEVRCRRNFQSRSRVCVAVSSRNGNHCNRECCYNQHHCEQKAQCFFEHFFFSSFFDNASISITIIIQVASKSQ